MRTCVAVDITKLEFNDEFMMWMIVTTFNDRYEAAMLCNGWEL